MEWHVKVFYRDKLKEIQAEFSFSQTLTDDHEIFMCY